MSDMAGKGTDQVVATAPGRVNLIGEHTDYNGGFVLPTTIPQRTTVSLTRRSDERVTATSHTLAQHAEYVLGNEARTGSFVDYVQGVTGALRTHGHQIGGFDVTIRSEVPTGSGLSSSAALEVALLRGLAELYQLDLAPLDLVKLAQWGENNVVGAPVGVLDPMACHLCAPNSALFVDTRTLTYETVPLPANAEFVVLDSGVKHSHASGGYRTRRAECEQAARELGVPQLRDVTVADEARYDTLPAPLNRRVKHVVTENARVLAAVTACKDGDVRRLGVLFAESHRSMRQDFEVSVPEVDDLVERASALDAVFGARLTGGGFGGSIVCLVARGRSNEVVQALEHPPALVLVPRPQMEV